MLNVVGQCAGRAVLVFGAGGVGLSAAMGARLLGADPIIVVDVVPKRLELARRFGASHTISADGTDVVAAVLEIAADGVDWAIEAVGQATTLRQSVSCLRPGGTTVSIGLGRADATVDLPINELVQRQKRIVGSLYGSANPLTDLPRIFQLYRSGKLPLDELVGERYPLDGVNAAYDALIHGALGRAVVTPGR
jgi:S-(hydroxymethyl)glutathione dehydrogenase/alcohol dehydrogenase